ncbi:oleate hydratase [Enterobacter kobei]|uniref:oleate hydratase n=1 Tax=Enterobacter kobei TaxID=208224 RepID=UPI002875B4DC|nr:oleate hydratase [Enterobacter kobei]MDS0026498.1 oleate hydratase [Enterobacter kobei]
MPYITAFFAARQADRPDVVPAGYAVDFAFIGQFARSKRRLYLPPPVTRCTHADGSGLHAVGH